jgi:hypothetical protein
VETRRRSRKSRKMKEGIIRREEMKIRGRR